MLVDERGHGPKQVCNKVITKTFQYAWTNQKNRIGLQSVQNAGHIILCMIEHQTKCTFKHLKYTLQQQ